MRKFLLRRCLPFIICFTVAPVLSLAQSPDNTPLTNAAIVKLVKAGFKEKSIITIIASRPARFELSTERMIDLKRSGVSEKVILAMLARQEGNEIDDSFGDDEFFSSSMPSS